MGFIRRQILADTLTAMGSEKASLMVIRRRRAGVGDILIRQDGAGTSEKGSEKDLFLRSFFARLCVCVFPNREPPAARGRISC